MILGLLLSFIGGCIYMIRGGSAYFCRLPRWATVLMQLVIILPLVIYYHLSSWLLLIYPIGWYLTIMTGWGKIYDCKTWKKRTLFFLRMSHSAALFVPLTLISGLPVLNSLFYTSIFALITVGIYTLYNKQGGHTDDGFNWAEFITGAILSGMAFNLILKLNNG